MFITLEGVDCSGKTSAISRMSQYLDAHGTNNIVTREPGGTALGNSLRTMLLNGEKFNNHTELLLFMAARSHHIDLVIRPALINNTVVLCDRYVDSSLVYQSSTVGHMFQLNDWCDEYGWLIEPDIVLYFQVSANVAIERMCKRGTKDNIEQRINETTIQSYIDKYDDLARHKGFVIIDANCDENTVQSAVQTILYERVINCDW